MIKKFLVLSQSAFEICCVTNTSYFFCIFNLGGRQFLLNFACVQWLFLDLQLLSAYVCLCYFSNSFINLFLYTTSPLLNQQFSGKIFFLITDNLSLLARFPHIYRVLKNRKELSTVQLLWLLHFHDLTFSARRELNFHMESIWNSISIKMYLSSLKEKRSTIFVSAFLYII